MASSTTSKSKKKDADSKNQLLVFEVDPMECPFREFKDNELSSDLWGLGPAQCRVAILQGKLAKTPVDYVWVDDQTQPLPRSVRQYLHGWIRAEDLAMDRWGAEVVVFEDTEGSGKMSVIDTQLSHAQVLVRSSFCRKVLSMCYMLERVDGLTVEYQWENFVFSYADGWKARYHIYSPGMKSGGGTQHRPTVSKNGCYLVRLYYLGAWRCVWVNDQVPVDATDAPLLPFSPLLQTQHPKPGVKSVPPAVYSNVVQLWPMLICKALLKLAAPDMNCDGEDVDAECVEDEPMLEFNFMHALTGCMDITFSDFDPDKLWQLLISEVTMFAWDDDDVTATSTVKSKTIKKPNPKENKERTRNSVTTVLIRDTKDAPPYLLPGITPSHQMSLMVLMARDLPLKKPLPEPEVAPWKHIRWVDWARRHGLYEAYECPRNKFLKVTGLMKLSHAPHLLDVISTESITAAFRKEQSKSDGQTKKPGKLEKPTPQGKATSLNQLALLKEELRDWMPYDPIASLALELTITYFPSMYEFTTAASSPPIRITKAPPSKELDIPAPKCSPLYLQIDGPEENILRIALSMLNPRVLINSGIPITEYLEPAYLILEKFEWFEDCELPEAKAFVQTKMYETVEVSFLPGRHFCRLWVHSRMNWHVMLLSESTLLLGPRDVIQAAAVRECPWAARFLNNLSNAFMLWIKYDRSVSNCLAIDREFYRSYQPDLFWDTKIVGYKQELLHWMFRQALQSHFLKRLTTQDYHSVCKVLRHFLRDPDFGLPPKPLPPKSLREIVELDPCDCVIPEVEELLEEVEEKFEEEVETEEMPRVNPDLMAKLLTPPTPPNVSQICEFATEEVPCGILKEEREKMIKLHDAAIFLQANWRGTWARKCLNVKMAFTPEVLKLVMDNAFGNLESLSALMNEFFGMFPGAKTAYSVASALSGVNGLLQYQGTSSATPKCKWIPYFQGVFYCHDVVKVHFTIHSSLLYSTVTVYNNDTGLPLPQAYNAHITFDISPNDHGYTVISYGTLAQPRNVNFEVQWQLTILSSITGVFHVCDNDTEKCKEYPLPGSQKLHIDEMFIPNRRDILGGLLMSVTKEEAVSFRVAASSPDLEMVATLRIVSPQGGIKEVASCSGKGEIFWPYISVHPFSPEVSHTNIKKKSMSKVNMTDSHDSPGQTARSIPKAQAASKKPASAKNKSATKLKVTIEPRQYSIQVTAPSGWPLNLAQWTRVDEMRNTDTSKRRDSQVTKKPVKGKGGKELTSQSMTIQGALYVPQLDDAYVELECALPVGGGVTVRRDNMRDLEYAAARKAWDAEEPGRNAKGAVFRNEFRTEFLVPITQPESIHSLGEEILEELETDEATKAQNVLHQGPTPATESGLLEISVEVEEEAKYYTMPEQLREKFIPLFFLPFCLKERVDEEPALLTIDMAEAAKQDRNARIEAAIERMKELQAYNELQVLSRQRKRCRLLHQFSIDATWCDELMEVLEERDNAIAAEQLARIASANRKKQEQKDQQKKK